MMKKVLIILLVIIFIITIIVIYLLIALLNNNNYLSSVNFGTDDFLNKNLNSLKVSPGKEKLAKKNILEVKVDLPTTSPNTSSSSATESVSQEVFHLENDILYDVPFTSQAPRGDWSDIRMQNGCEEAVALMAISWARGKNFTTEEAEAQIIAMSEYQLENYNHFHDTSTKDTLARIIKGYFNFTKADLRVNIDTNDIKFELAQGNVVIIPVNGQKLQNPYFTPPGPIEHMILVIGFNQDLEEFVVHDPGTKRGKAMRYSEEIIFLAMQDYPSGYHLPIEDVKTAMIVVRAN